jgi:hypothetical protein
MKDSDRYHSEIARHEAGHAIVAHVEGFEVEAIEFHPDGGSVYHAGPADLLDKGQNFVGVAMSYALICCAGKAASPNTDMSGADNEGLERAMWLGGFDRRWFYSDRAAFLELAIEIIDHHRDGLERVADALVRRGRLSGDEFREILTGEK